LIQMSGKSQWLLVPRSAAGVVNEARCAFLVNLTVAKLNFRVERRSGRYYRAKIQGDAHMARRSESR
jgi:hypothetical protein